jgi:hypothetical protein
MNAFTLTQSERRPNRERIMVIVTILSFIFAFVWGVARETENIEPHRLHAYPSADRFDKLSADTFSASQKDTKIGYVSILEANGYGGPLQIAVTNTTIIDTKIGS